MNIFDDPDTHIINQLRKVIDLHGKYKVIFLSKETEYITPLSAHKALNIYDLCRTSIHKHEISDKLFLSKESFFKVIGQEYNA